MIIRNPARISPARLLFIAIAIGFSSVPASQARDIRPLVLEGSLDSSFERRDCANRSKPLNIKRNTALNPKCTYRHGFRISRSNITLDCRGAIIAGGVKSKAGILISAPSDLRLENVTVRNCIITNQPVGIQVSRTKWRRLKRGHENENGFRRILISNLRILDSKGSGIYLTPYVSGVTIRKVEIAGSGESGIYFDSGTTGNRLQNSEIHHNGFGRKSKNTKIISFGPVRIKALLTGREGIALDGAFNNKIIGNHIHHNAVGGIYAYRNCGEGHSKKRKRWYRRRYGANGNVMRGNRIENEINGIWIASRASQNQYFMDCGGAAYRTGVLFKIHRDQAKNNRVIANQFRNVRYAIRIEGDGSVVTNNLIHSRSPNHVAVLVGSLYRGKAGSKPLRGVKIVDNIAVMPDNRRPFLQVSDARKLRFSGNINNSRAIALARGEYPKPDPYLFVRDWSPAL